VKGDKTTVYKAGDVFFEPGDVTHRAYNRGKDFESHEHRNLTFGLQRIGADTSAAVT
jgi:quercetin dioxygenase-like cupin family protein